MLELVSQRHSVPDHQVKKLHPEPLLKLLFPDTLINQLNLIQSDSHQWVKLCPQTASCNDSQPGSLSAFDHCLPIQSQKLPDWSRYFYCPPDLGTSDAPIWQERFFPSHVCKYFSLHGMHVQRHAIWPYWRFTGFKDAWWYLDWHVSFLFSFNLKFLIYHSKVPVCHRRERISHFLDHIINKLHVQKN